MCYLFTSCFKGLNTACVYNMIIKQRIPEITSRLRVTVSEQGFTIENCHSVFRCGNAFRKLSVLRICVSLGKWAFLVYVIRKTLYRFRRNWRKWYFVLAAICDKASMKLIRSRCIGRIYYCTRFGTVMVRNTNVFWHVTPCSQVVVYRCLERYCLLPPSV